MSSGWNQFDFLLVLGNLMSLLEKDLGSQFLALRSFRCFRPLRAMKNFRDGQLLVRTVLKSLPLMRDALIFLGWFMLVAGVSGTMLFGGKLTGRCTAGLLPPPPPPFPGGYVVEVAAAGIGDFLSCPPRANVSDAGAICDPVGNGFTCDAAMGEVCCKSTHLPVDGFLNFDNFARSAIIVMQIITIDGWNELAVPAADATVGLCAS